MECVIRVENGEYVLRDRATGVEYARGTEQHVRQFAEGVHTITDAPRLRPVEDLGTNSRGYREFSQGVDESAVFQGRLFTPGIDEWIGAVLYPDHLGISFTERLADAPQFVQQVQSLTGVSITSVRGSASIAALGDPPLLGDWIRTGRFQPDRLARRFEQDLGGTWRVIVSLKNSRVPQSGYTVSIDRVAGS